MRQFEEPQHLVVFTDSDRTGKRQQGASGDDEREEPHRDDNHQVQHLVDEDLFQLIKEKFDAKAEVEEKDNIVEQNIIEMDEFNDENEDETSLKCNMQVFNERKLNVKDFNVEERVQCNDHRELLLVGLVHHLYKEARYLTRNIEYDHTTQYVNNLEDAVNWMFSEPHSRSPRLLTYPETGAGRKGQSLDRTGRSDIALRA